MHENNNDNDPYATPEVYLDTSSIDHEAPDIARGQRMIIYAILVNILASVLQVAVHPLFSLLALVSLVMAFMGIFRLGTVLGDSILLKLLLCLVMLVPLVNLIVLVILSTKATSRLRAAGYEVGLMGAKRKG